MNRTPAPPRRPPPPRQDAKPSESDVYDTMVAVTGTDPNSLLAEMQKTNDQIFEVRKALAKEKAQLARLESEVNMFDHMRKGLLSRIAENRRLELEKKISVEIEDEGKATTKVVEAALDTYAHAHPEYLAYIEEARDKRREYEDGRATMDELWAKIHHLTGIQEYITQRLRLSEEQIRFYRSMSNLGG